MARTPSPFEFRRTFDPNAAEVARSLESVSRNIVATSLLGIGESGLTVAALEDPAVSTIELAVPVLFKLVTCLGEEWSYEPWSVQDVARHHAPRLAAEAAGWRAQPESDPTKCVEYLSSVARATLTADTGRGEWFERATCHPDQKTARASRLEQLDSVREENLRTVLADSWNSITAVFRVGDTWYLVDWWTTQ